MTTKFRFQTRTAQSAERFLRLYVGRNGATPAEEAEIEKRRTLRMHALVRGWRRHAQPTEPDDEPEPLPPLDDRRKPTPETAVFRECVLRAVGYFPQAGTTIREAVLADYGSHSERRFWRAMAYLIRKRLVDRTADGYRLARRSGAGT